MGMPIKKFKRKIEVENLYKEYRGREFG